MLLYGKNINRKELMNLNRKGVIFFLLSGVCTSLAWLFLFYALSLGKVVTVIPIANSYLLLTVSLSYFFLRDLERVDYKIVIAAFSVVIGIALLSLSN